MTTMLNFFGFVDLPSTIWNLFAYGGMVVILFGVKSKNYRPHLIGSGAVVLMFFAFIFLKDYILAGLQLLISISAVFEIARTSKKVSASVTLVLSAILFLALIFGGYVPDLLRWLGIGGAFGIAFGLTLAPKKSGFATMGAGGALLVIYSPFVGAWVFFFLNLIFAVREPKLQSRIHSQISVFIVNKTNIGFPDAVKVFMHHCRNPVAVGF